MVLKLNFEKQVRLKQSTEDWDRNGSCANSTSIHSFYWIKFHWNLLNAYQELDIEKKYSP